MDIQRVSLMTDGKGCTGMPRKSRTSCAEGHVVQYTTIKARLYPNEEQAVLFENTFGCCRYIWNRMLADQQRFYEKPPEHPKQRDALGASFRFARRR